MPTPEESRDFAEALADIKALIVAKLVEKWITDIQGNPADLVDDLRQFVLDIVAEFGQVAAATAIDFYESVRPPGSPPFRPVPSVRDDLISGPSLNWSTAPLLGDDPEKALERVAAEIQKAAQDAAVETMGQATSQDLLEVKYARWPTNDDPCAYCVLRASKGAVYWTEATAERGDHIKCQCNVTPVFEGEELPYNRDAYLADYTAGRDDAEDALGDPSRSPSTKAILAGMRRANGTR